MNAERTLAIAGLWGAALTVVILAMSVLLRLGTQIEAGEVVSTLPSALEQGARIAHRVAAMGVAALAALALVAALRARPVPRRWAVACIAALTLLLAIIGRYTPGYRLDLVTIVNVVAGTALACAFWWLRAPGDAAPRHSDAVAWIALALLLALAALGAAANAAAMRGERAFGPLHLWLAAIFTLLALTAAWRRRRRRGLAIAVATLAPLQFGVGFLLVGVAGARPIALVWGHAMIACALALLLVSLAAPIRGRP